MRNSAALAAIVLSLTVACSGSNGSDGPIGPSGPAGASGPSGPPGVNAPTTGTITGTVTDAVAGTPIANVSVTVKTTGGAQLATGTTDANGGYSVTAPIGTVAIAFAKQYFTSPGDLMVGVLGGLSVTANASMAEASTGKPAVSLASAATDVGYGALTTVTASATDPNGDTLTYAWSNATVPAIGSVSGSGTTATVTLPTMTAAFARRLESATAPNQYVSGYVLENRFGIVPITPDTRGEMSVKVTVTDGRGQTSSATVTIDAASVLTAARNVAIGTRVYLNSGHDGTSAWTLANPPAGSAAALDDPTSRTPSFVADLAGSYTVSEGANTMTIYAGDWTGVITGGTGDAIVVDSTCRLCHNGTFAPDNFTPWAATPHATMMTRGIDGGNGSYYGAACIVCHTVGNDRGVVNNGFDDVAATAGWTFPSTFAPTNWANMVTGYPAVARLANIQCENCHGPQTSDAHMQTGTTGAFTSPRIGFGAELCATCHASGTGHHNYSEWSTVDATTGWGHSNRGGTNYAASTTGLNAHCGRCHSAQGYATYAGQLAAGKPGNIAAGSAVLTSVTRANVEPVTCTACHDPHDATNPSQLRFYGDTPLLAAGFQMYGVGKGALCMTCHNSRNGTLASGGTYLHEDGETYNSGNPTGFSAPHQACQTDVFAGRNAYFLGSATPMTSRHAAIEDACAGCHMTLNPETHVSHGSDAVSTHVFRVTDANRGTLCAKCHGATVDGEGIAATVEAGLVNLGGKIANAVKTKANGALQVKVVAYDSTTDLYSASSGFVVDTAANPITGASIVEIHGQIGFNLTFTNPVTVQFVDASGSPYGAPRWMSTIGVQLGSLKDGAGAAPLFALGGNLVRAGWNYFLVEGDQSKGLHNPTFVNTVLNASMGKDLSN